MANDALCYEVPDIQLVVQDHDMACWYASALMLIEWRERNRPGVSCEMLDNETIRLYKANKGIQNAQIIPLAQRLGLVAVPPMSPTINSLATWLKDYGPLWTNGTRHIVVIGGIRGSQGVGFEVKVYDPWPGKGVTWRTLDGWYAGYDPGANAASSRDTSVDVQAVFLRIP